MGWREWSLQVKILGIISIFLIVLFLSISVFVFLTSEGLENIIGVMFLYYTIIIFGMWAIGIFNKHMINKNRRWWSNIIIVVLLIFFISNIIRGIIQQLNLNQITLSTYFIHSIPTIIPQIIIIFYLIISFIIINTKSLV